MAYVDHVKNKSFKGPAKPFVWSRYLFYQEACRLRNRQDSLPICINYVITAWLPPTPFYFTLSFRYLYSKTSSITSGRQNRTVYWREQVIIQKRFSLAAESALWLTVWKMFKHLLSTECSGYDRALKQVILLANTPDESNVKPRMAFCWLTRSIVISDVNWPNHAFYGECRTRGRFCLLSIWN